MVLRLMVSFDVLGNLTQKFDQSAIQGGGFKNLTETYVYDNLNRLLFVDQGPNNTLLLSYDALGNITTKRAYTTTGAVDGNADVGSYSYSTRIVRINVLFAKLLVYWY